MNAPMPSVAIVGAGMSGLACARSLADQGYPVTVFEKSRGVGGRMSTRRTLHDISFDHGAQYFTTRGQKFRHEVNLWCDNGIVKPWAGRIVVLENGMIKERKSATDRFVATPGMNAICKHLTDGLDVRLETPVAPLERTSNQWTLTKADGTELGFYDVAIVSAPSSQAATLLRAVPTLSRQAEVAKMNGCWAVMLALPRSLGLSFEGAFVHGSPISWVANNSSKTGRHNGSEAWVVHASSEWSQDCIDEEPETIGALLVDEFSKAVGMSPLSPVFSTAHRWRFAQPLQPLSESCLFDHALGVGACGDWCAGPRVEGAFLSGTAAADHVIRLFQKEPPGHGDTSSAS